MILTFISKVAALSFPLTLPLPFFWMLSNCYDRFQDFRMEPWENLRQHWDHDRWESNVQNDSVVSVLCLGWSGCRVISSHNSLLLITWRKTSPFPSRPASDLPVQDVTVPYWPRVVKKFNPSSLHARTLICSILLDPLKKKTNQDLNDLPTLDIDFLEDKPSFYYKGGQWTHEDMGLKKKDEINGK